eukprot:TRINITY_DN122_c0_g1_i9.p1 TRINITY_DN122_c0_g1~~TRINITY_DN122_c0_g1_i9.p1  ORF type:complete len:572 (+),score=68.04 TRINITY_DN122_c0_g1_i9:148-1863(+)
MRGKSVVGGGTAEQSPFCQSSGGGGELDGLVRVKSNHGKELDETAAATGPYPTKRRSLARSGKVAASIRCCVIASLTIIAFSLCIISYVAPNFRKEMALHETSSMNNGTVVLYRRMRPRVLVMYELYYDEKAWDVLHRVEPFQPLCVRSGKVQSEEGDIDAAKVLPLLADDRYQALLCEYGAFFALAAHINTIQKGIPWVAFQSWRAEEKKLGLSEEALWQLQVRLQRSLVLETEGELRKGGNPRKVTSPTGSRMVFELERKGDEETQRNEKGGVGVGEDEKVDTGVAKAMGKEGSPGVKFATLDSEDVGETKDDRRTMYFWANFDSLHDTMHVYTQCDNAHKTHEDPKRCSAVYATAFWHLFSPEAPPLNGSAHLSLLGGQDADDFSVIGGNQKSVRFEGDDAGAELRHMESLPPLPTSKLRWAYCSYFAMHTDFFRQYVRFARMFFVTLESIWGVHNSLDQCPLGFEMQANEGYNSRLCWCFIMERAVNVWAYHSGMRMMLVDRESGNFTEMFPVHNREDMWMHWFNVTNLERLERDFAARLTPESLALFDALQPSEEAVGDVSIGKQW